MNDQALRYRIENAILAKTTATPDDTATATQAIIDDLGLTVETKIDKPGQRGINPVHRIVGKWER